MLVKPLTSHFGARRIYWEALCKQLCFLPAGGKKRFDPYHCRPNDRRDVELAGTIWARRGVVSEPEEVVPAGFGFQF